MVQSSMSLSAAVDIPCTFTHSYTSMTVHALSRQRQRTCIGKRAQRWSRTKRGQHARCFQARLGKTGRENEASASKSSEKRIRSQTAQGMAWATKCRETDLHLLRLIVANGVEIRMPAVSSASVVFCQRKRYAVIAIYQRAFIGQP
jgi:hypothetical protein